MFGLLNVGCLVVKQSTDSIEGCSWCTYIRTCI